MAKDIVYYFDKITHKRNELGEIQKGFNMSFVIDGTKDSAKLQVIGFSESEIEPNTIILHEATQTWWIVSHDKVERYYHEINNVYKHNLELLGAIELLNARDLTDCGFNGKTYTLEQFIKRLFKLSNYEFSIALNPIDNSIDTSLVVDYIKTFENYTLLSSIREMLDGYNCTAKLRFATTKTGDDYFITSSYLDIYSKVGKGSVDFVESDFTNVKETKTMDKNSFGTIVVSNAENVISTKAKMFPTASSVRLSSHSYDIDKDNAVLRLPSNIFKVNYVEMIRPVKIIFTYRNVTTILKIETIDLGQIKKQLTYFITNTWQVEESDIKIYYLTQIDLIATQTVKAMTTKFWYNDNYDPIEKKFLPIENISGFYMPYVVVKQTATSVVYEGNVQVTNNELGQSVQNFRCAFYYERGKNEITNFRFLGRNNIEKSYLDNYNSTDLGESNRIVITRDFEYQHPTLGTVVRHTQCEFGSNFANDTDANITPKNTSWRVNYIPMSDLKVKYDNSGDSKDVQLYNQVGKLTDSVALSKLVLSYSKEIESDTITKYKSGYNFSTLPKIGDSVSIGSNAYVINNISYDFYQNEQNVDDENNNFYYIVGEFTMSKWTSTKSLMTNPNTNIRDYGIPQNNNVDRKQLYRDFYELDFTVDSGADTNYYMTFNKLFNLTNYYKELNEHVAVIKLTYSGAYGGGGNWEDGEDTEVEPSDTWYYQLDTTTYVMKKAIYEVVNFNDNNIIGYCSQNVNSAFDIRRIFSGMTDAINTPISYVDEKGQVESFYIAMCSSDKLSEIYYDYLEAMKTKYEEQSYNGNLINYSIFIPSEIYEGGEAQQGSQTTSETTQEITGSYNQLLDRTIYICNISSLGILPPDFDENPSNMSVNVISCIDENEVDRTGTLDFADITLSDNIYRARFVFNSNTEHTMSITFSVTYPHETPLFLGAKDKCEFQINEINYDKDAIEVPIFEYSCQIDDTENIIVGDNILDSQSGDKYAYSYYLVDKNTINENTFGSITLEKIHLDLVSNELIAYWNNAVKFDYDSSEIKISLYGSCSSLKISSESTPIFTNNVTLTSLMFSDKDLVIARHTIPAYATAEEVDGVKNINTTNSLLLVVKNIGSSSIVDNKIVLKINHYKIS